LAGLTDKRIDFGAGKEVLHWRHVVGLVTLALQLNDQLPYFLQALSILQWAARGRESSPEGTMVKSPIDTLIDLRISIDGWQQDAST
jgi:hypothetical protein